MAPRKAESSNATGAPTTQGRAMTPTEEPPTRNQLWQWCLRGDAVAQCFVRDVLALRSSSSSAEATAGKDQDTFWWLGTVPCRCVRTVGMVVGARAYERRTVYTLDDGTGVIQCAHLHPGGKPKSRKQTELPPPPPPPPTTVAPEDIPKPVYEVGDVLRVAGRVEAWHDSFQIVVNEIELCRPNDEPDHWIATARLHETYYAQPFVIPPLPELLPPRTPVKPTSIAAEFATPNSVTTVATPSTTTSSPSVQVDGLVLLRHPSRLHSRDLLSSTFKIYLKNYMDVLSDPSRNIPLGLSRRDSSSDVSESWAKHRNHGDDQSTPRPKDRRNRQWQQEEEAATPRPISRGDKENTPRNGHPPQTKGFTLSYLRRVPELADLAFRVIDAETKRRAREARRKEKEAIREGKQRAPAGASQSHPEPARRKAKRLYTWAIRELYKEGSIVLHDDDAPVWALATGHDTRGVWRPRKSADRSVDAGGSETSMLSARDASTHTVEEDDDRGELSDPPAHEESYIPLTPALLMDPVVDTIRSMMRRSRPPNAAKQSAGGGAFHHHTDNKVVGPSAEELREHMGKLDARWENVTVYAVVDTLELLKAQDRVYKIGKGRWEIPL